VGQLGAAKGAACLAALCCATSAYANKVTLTDGRAGLDGHFDVTVDDFGCYGSQIGMQENDTYLAPGRASTFAPTYISGVFLSLTTPGSVTSRVVLTDYAKWHQLLEAGPQPDGIVGAHTALTRKPTTFISGTSLEATSAFEVADAPSGLKLDFALKQTIVPMVATGTADFHQVYTITNNGTVAVDLVFHAAWEIDLYYSDSSWENDIVGVSPDFCTVYAHDPGSSVFAGALGDGGSTVPRSYYYGGKQAFVPDAAGPPMTPLNAMQLDMQYVWLAGGTPVTWRNFIPGKGYNVAGEDPTIIGDATLGRDYRFSLAVGASETIHLLRRYGSTTIPCPPTLQSCGNNVVDAGELCDGMDTATCNGATCAASMCGDGHVNMIAGEDCESNGIDSDTCNGMTCSAAACGDGYVNAAANETCDDGGESASCNVDCTPAACGDGYVNLLADEECEGGDLCDLETCKVTFTVGGGCAGCGAGDAEGASLWLAGIIVVVRRRRRARAA
jgi:hypothetical protein